MKKLLIAVTVLAVIAAGLLGFVIYNFSHIYIEDAVYAKGADELDLRGTGISVQHYEAAHAQLPDCHILWDVPFQGGEVSSNVKELDAKGFTSADLQLIPYFTDLERINVQDCRDYGLLEGLQRMLPDCRVNYFVDVGGTEVDRYETGVTLETGTYEYETLMTNLKHLPDMKAVSFRHTELDAEKFDSLCGAYPDILFGYTIDLLGKELDAETTSVDLTSMTSADVEDVAKKLPMLASLETIQLADGTAEGGLTLEEVKKLKDAAPHIKIKYTFELYGETITTDDEEMLFRNKRKYINNDTLYQVRQALDIMNNCTRLVLDNTAASDSEVAQLREDYRGKTNVVWRVYFADYGSSLTDVEVLRVVYDLGDDNCKSLKYLENVKYMDLGHNEYLDYCDFVSSMTELEVAIISGAPIKSLEPFANCKKLKFLEMANCSYIPDLEPLRNCTELEMLNISFTSITDLSPIDELPITHLTAVRNQLPEEEEARYTEAHPDCWIVMAGDQPYGQGWRYDKDNQTKLPWYAKLAEAFRYPDPYNKTGWYLK